MSIYDEKPWLSRYDPDFSADACESISASSPTDIWGAPGSTGTKEEM